MEKEQKKFEVTKKSNLPIIIIVILSLVIVLMGVYIFTSNGLFVGSDNSQKNEGITSEIKDNNNEEANKAEPNDVIKELDLSKCLNSSDNIYSNPTDVEENYGLSMNTNSDKKSITLIINWDKFGPLTNAAGGGTESYQITGFTKEIESTFIGTLGQSSTGLTLFYLMSDGTVEYTPMFVLKTDSQSNTYLAMNYIYEYSSDNRVTGQHFITNGSLVGVSDVIKLYNVSAGSSSGSGWLTTIGAKADGSFYDLGAIINN